MEVRNIEVARMCLRPILMTPLAFILGAVTGGAGSARKTQ